MTLSPWKGGFLGSHPPSPPPRRGLLKQVLGEQGYSQLLPTGTLDELRSHLTLSVRVLKPRSHRLWRGRTLVSSWLRHTSAGVTTGCQKSEVGNSIPAIFK